MSRALLVLRPEPGGDRTVALARGKGFDAAGYPLFQVRPCAWEGPDPANVDALLFTSANAVRHGGDGLARYRALPAYAIGPATAEALRAAGFARVMAGSDGVQQVVGLMSAAGHGQALHFSGADVRPYGASGVNIARVTVYESVEAGDAQGLAAVLRPGMILLVHSPRAGVRLARLVALGDRAALRIVAISPAALAAAGQGWARGLAADRPDDKAMLALAATLCDGFSAWR